LRPTDDSLPSQSDLKRAVSAGYYAMFHYVSRSCADELAGGRSKPLTRAAAQIYRSLDHRDIAAACEKASNNAYGFPSEIRQLAWLFLRILKTRHKADYDPTSTFTLQQVGSRLTEIEDAFRKYAAVPQDDRRAFAILVAVKSPARGRG
jgi:hypothetical protein